MALPAIHSDLDECGRQFCIDLGGIQGFDDSLILNLILKTP